MIKTEYKNHILTAYIDGEIDHDSAAKIRARIDGAAQSVKPPCCAWIFRAFRSWIHPEWGW